MGNLYNPYTELGLQRTGKLAGVKVRGPLVVGLSVVHLPGLVVSLDWLGVLNVVVALSIGHGLVQVGLVLGLLHVQRVVLVVSVHVRVVPLGDLVYRNWPLYRLVLLVKHLRHVALQFVSLRLHILDCEADDCAADLHGHGVLGLESQLLLEQNDGAELGGVVLDVEPVMLALDDGVTPTHTDVVDSHLAFVASSEFELRLVGGHCEQMDVTRSILVQRHRLQQNVVIFHIHLL